MWRRLFYLSFGCFKVNSGPLNKEQRLSHDVNFCWEFNPKVTWSLVTRLVPKGWQSALWSLIREASDFEYNTGLLSPNGLTLKAIFRKECMRYLNGKYFLEILDIFENVCRRYFRNAQITPQRNWLPYQKSSPSILREIQSATSKKYFKIWLAVSELASGHTKLH